MIDRQQISGRLSDPLVSGLTFVVSLLLGLIVGVAASAAIVFVEFNNTRADGGAAFLIALIGVGLFTNLVAFAAITTRHHAPSPYTALFTLLPWLSLALFLTCRICKSSYISWDNWRWILASKDERSYELTWIIRGWTAIALAMLAGLLTNWNILRGKRKS